MRDAAAIKTMVFVICLVVATAWFGKGVFDLVIVGGVLVAAYKLWCDAICRLLGFVLRDRA